MSQAPAPSGTQAWERPANPEDDPLADVARALKMAEAAIPGLPIDERYRTEALRNLTMAQAACPAIAPTGSGVGLDWHGQPSGSGPAAAMATLLQRIAGAAETLGRLNACCAITALSCAAGLLGRAHDALAEGAAIAGMETGPPSTLWPGSARFRAREGD